MPEFNCHICGSKKGRIIAKAEDMRFKCFGHDKNIHKCNDCGLSQLAPQWTDDELDNLYKEYWSKPDFSGQKRKVKISKYLENHMKKGEKILEIGCGWGDNVNHLRARGFDVIGLDKDPQVCDGKKILNYDFKDYRPEEKYDVIYGMHLLEHMTKPLDFLDQVLRLLKPEGRFLFEVPNMEEPLLSIYRNNAFRKFYWYPYHLFFYTPETATNVFSKIDGTEIDIQRRQEYGLINHMRWLLLNRPGNYNKDLPVLDNVYKNILAKSIRKSDTMIIHGRKKKK
jgi:cyclopropane fatty-acyl-phospholipid synthase-like methyltransferase